MKFYVDCIIHSEKELNETLSECILLAYCRQIKINDSVCSIHYGDIVYCEGKKYFVNENSIDAEHFDHRVDVVWDVYRQGYPPKEKFVLIQYDNDSSKRYHKSLEIFERFDNTIIHINQAGIINTFGRSPSGMYYDTDRKVVFELKGGCTTDVIFERQINKIPKFVGKAEQQELTETCLFIDESGRLSYFDKQSEQTIDLSQIELNEWQLEQLKGKDGVDGQDGRPGKDGKDGIDGTPGKDGKDGLPGIPGKAGRDGKDGIPGKDGNSGKDGVPGRNGKDGKDGAKGDKGDRGEPGPPGEIKEIYVTESKEPSDILDKLNLIKGESENYSKTIDGLKQELEHLKKSYSLYTSRLNTQLASLGGGGSSRITEMDDVVFTKRQNISNNSILVYDNTVGTIGKFKSLPLDQAALAANVIPIYIQNTAPVTSATKYLWIETDIGGDANSFTFWIETGA